MGTLHVFLDAKHRYHGICDLVCAAPCAGVCRHLPVQFPRHDSAVDVSHVVHSGQHLRPEAFREGSRGRHDAGRASYGGWPTQVGSHTIISYIATHMLTLRKSFGASVQSSCQASEYWLGGCCCGCSVHAEFMTSRRMREAGDPFSD